MNEKVTFVNLYSTYSINDKESNAVAFNYDKCKLFYNKEPITIDEFNDMIANLDNIYCKIILHIKSINIENNNASIDLDVLQLHLKKENIE